MKVSLTWENSARTATLQNCPQKWCVSRVVERTISTFTNSSSFDSFHAYKMIVLTYGHITLPLKCGRHYNQDTSPVLKWRIIGVPLYIAVGYAKLTAHVLDIGHLTFWGCSVANVHRYIAVYHENSVFRAGTLISMQFPW